MIKSRIICVIILFFPNSLFGQKIFNLLDTTKTYNSTQLKERHDQLISNIENLKEVYFNEIPKIFQEKIINTLNKKIGKNYLIKGNDFIKNYIDIEEPLNDLQQIKFITPTFSKEFKNNISITKTEYSFKNNLLRKLNYKSGSVNRNSYFYYSNEVLESVISDDKKNNIVFKKINNEEINKGTTNFLLRGDSINIYLQSGSKKIIYKKNVVDKLGRIIWSHEDINSKTRVFWTFEYDKLGKLIKQTRDYPGYNDFRINTFSYENNGLLAKISFKEIKNEEIIHDYLTHEFRYKLYRDKQGKFYVKKYSLESHVSEKHTFFLFDEKFNYIEKETYYLNDYQLIKNTRKIGYK